jgi:hypothetical protein
MRSLSYGLLFLLTAGLLVGCDGVQDLDVDNESNPDRERVLATPADVQSIAAGLFETYHGGTEGVATIGGVDAFSPTLMTSVHADTHTASWGNFSMRDHGREPRITWNNDPAYTYAAHNEQPYFQSYTTISNALDVLSAVENVGADRINGELGPGSAALLRANAQFMMGLSYMHLSARFDKGSLIDETDEFQGQEFVPWPRVLEFGLSKMGNAIEIANNNEFTIPSTPAWFFNLEMSSAEMAALGNSLRAKYATLAARSPSQRQSLNYLSDVDWSTIITWINNGMRSAPGGYETGVFGPRTAYPGNPAGFFPTGSEGFPRHWEGDIVYQESVAQSDTWARADYQTIGRVNTATDDGTNEFDQWKASLDATNSLSASDLYVTESPDRRLVGAQDPTCGQYQDGGRVGFSNCFGNPGATLENAGDGKYFGFRGTVTQNAAGEVVPIPDSDGPFPVSRGRWHYSDRAHDRYVSWQLAVGSGATQGPMPHTLEAEMDLLLAEALLQTGGDLSRVASLINETRVEKGEMAPATVGDGAGSITGQPLNPLKDPGKAGSDRQEATLYSMLKYEFIIETWSTSAGVHWMAKRGWGGLREGSTLQYPIPGSELNTLGEDNYTFGGVGGDCVSAGIGESQNTSGCSKPFGGGGGGSVVLDKSDSHWSTLPGSGGATSTTPVLNLGPQ